MTLNINMHKPPSPRGLPARPPPPSGTGQISSESGAQLLAPATELLPSSGSMKRRSSQHSDHGRQTSSISVPRWASPSEFSYEDIVRRSVLHHALWEPAGTNSATATAMSYSDMNAGLNDAAEKQQSLVSSSLSSAAYIIEPTESADVSDVSVIQVAAAELTIASNGTTPQLSPTEITSQKRPSVIIDTTTEAQDPRLTIDSKDEPSGRDINGSDVATPVPAIAATDSPTAVLITSEHEQRVEMMRQNGTNTYEYPSTHKFFSQERKTRIICALGPSSRSVEVIGQLLDAGMNIARLNFSHGDHAYHAETLQHLREAVRLRTVNNQQCHCAVLLDTKGPEIRSGLLEDGKPVRLIAGQKLEITTDYTALGNQNRMACSYEALAETVKKGDSILVADGEITMRVISADKHKGTVAVRVENSAILEERKNMNLPGVTIRLPGITDKDRDDLINFALVHEVDIVSGSFIRTKENVMAIRDCLGEKGKEIRIHAKIESVEGLMNIHEILSVADGVHISRGDLGMELPLSKLFIVQKYVTNLCNLKGKPVVTSTQMLQSMVHNLRPTHAECTDVANAVLDGTDCVMLSGETASGENPVLAVETMASIIVEAERAIDYDLLYSGMNERVLEDLGELDPLEAIASAAVQCSIFLRARVLVVLSITGKMALLVAKYRPWARILVVTSDAATARQMNRSRGVSSLLLETMAKHPQQVWLEIVGVLRRWRWVHSKDKVVMVDTILDGDQARGGNLGGRGRSSQMQMQRQQSLFGSRRVQTPLSSSSATLSSPSLSSPRPGSPAQHQPPDRYDVVKVLEVP